MNVIQFFRNHKKLAVFLILFVIGFIIYGNSFNNEFFWDDDDSIVNNTYITDWKYIDKYFTENLIAGAGQTTDYWRPCLLVSFSTDYYFWGLNPFGFHLTNTLLHILAAYLLFLLLYALCGINESLSDISRELLTDWDYIKKIALPFIVSLLFLVHPLQTEAVTYVAGRADSLSTVFTLLAVLMYVKYRQREIKSFFHCKFFDKEEWKRFFSLKLGHGIYLVSLGFFILGLLSKEQVILLPLLIFLVEAVFFIKKISVKNIWKVIKNTLPFFLVSIIYFAMRLTVLNFNDILHGFNYGSSYNSNVWHRLLTFTSVMGKYLKLLFIPLNLHMAREVAVVKSIFSIPVMVFLIIAGLIISVCIFTWRENKLITFGLLWFFIILLPRTNIFQINRPMYEHWLYLPMAGFWMAFLSLAVLIFYRIKKEENKICVYSGLAFLIIFVIWLCVLTIFRNNDWQNAITFYEKNLEYTPNSFIQHNNLGMAYADKKRNEEAVKEYRTAIEINDIYPQVHYNLGNTLRDLGRIEEAEKEYEIAIEMSPDFFYPYTNLISIYGKEGDKEKAEDLLKKMEVKFSEQKPFLYTKGALYYNWGEFGKALKVWKEIKKIDPYDREILPLIRQAEYKLYK